jgi:hypothetical protein
MPIWNETQENKHNSLLRILETEQLTIHYSCTRKGMRIFEKTTNIEFKQQNIWVQRIMAHITESLNLAGIVHHRIQGRLVGKDVVRYNKRSWNRLHGSLIHVGLRQVCPLYNLQDSFFQPPPLKKKKTWKAHFLKNSIHYLNYCDYYKLKWKYFYVCTPENM